MDPDTQGTPLADIQPAAFLAALDEHRTQFGTAHALAVLVVRLDRFAHTSDSIGAQRAHQLRAQVKSRVARAVAMPVVMHWLGAADLAIACVMPDDICGADDLCRAVADMLGVPYLVDGFELFLSCSIGSALSRPDTGTERHLQQAFDAMLQVSRRGGDGIATANRPEAPRPATLRAALPGAVERGELSLQLQPRATFATADIASYTVRLRWQHPALGRVAPQDFLPAADSLGMMRDIGSWTLQQLLQLVRTSDIFGSMQFTLLTTSPELLADDTIGMLLRAIRDSKVVPGQVCVEVPVGIVPDASTAAAKAAALRDGGIHIALADLTDDDAGRRALDLVRPDMVTLDVRRLGHANQHPGTEASLRAACTRAISEGVPVCAKGVETQAQLDAVRNWGCDSMQGYLLAQPFPATWLPQTHLAIAERARDLLKR